MIETNVDRGFVPVGSYQHLDESGVGADAAGQVDDDRFHLICNLR